MRPPPLVWHSSRLTLALFLALATLQLTVTSAQESGRDQSRPAEPPTVNHQLESALTISEQAAEEYGRGSVEHIFSLAALGEMQNLINDLHGLESTMHDVARYATAVLGENNELTLSAWQMVGATRQELGNLGGSMEAYQNVLAGLLSTKSPANPDVLETQISIGHLHLELENPSTALWVFNKVDQQSEKGKTLNLIQVLFLIEGIANAHSALGQNEPLVAALLRMWNIAESGAADEHLFYVDYAATTLVPLYVELGRPDDALSSSRKHSEFYIQRFGQDDPRTIDNLERYAGLTKSFQEYREAVRVYEIVAKARQDQLGADSFRTLVAKRDLAATYAGLGEFGKSEALYTEVHQRLDETIGPTHPETVLTLGGLADSLAKRGQTEQANSLYRRAIELGTESLQESGFDAASIVSLDQAAQGGRDRLDAASAMQVYMLLDDSIKEWQLAVDFDDTKSRVTERFKGTTPGDADATGPALPDPRSLAYEGDPRKAELALEAYLEQDLETRAEYAFQYLEAARERSAQSVQEAEFTFGARSRPAALRHGSRGEILLVSGTFSLLDGDETGAMAFFSEADRNCELATDIFTELSGEYAPDSADTHLCRSNIAWLTGRSEDSLQFARRSSAVVERAIERTGWTNDFFESDDSSSVARTFGFMENPFLTHLRAIWVAAQNGEVGSAESADEALVVSQQAMARPSARALAQMAARVAAEDPLLAAAVRERQDAVRRWQSLNTEVIELISRRPEDRDRARESLLREEKVDAESVIREIDAVLTDQFPEYSDIASPPTLDLGSTQSLLEPGEALVVVLLGSPVAIVDQTFLLAITKTGAEFRSVPIGYRQIADAVNSIRTSLDAEANTANGEPSPHFDLDSAYLLTTSLLVPLIDTLEGATHLIFVLDGPLQSLPPSLWVTREPPEIAGPEDYRKVAWLINDTAVSMMPSVSALGTLRRQANASQGNRAFIGIGDPLLPGHPDQDAIDRLPVPPIDMDFGLRPIPETSTELMSVAQTLGADADRDVLTRDRATEANVRRANLSDYRVLAFATHGVMSGEDAARFGEAGLVLTPQSREPGDDGYLTASEVATLRLDADWVILSACNTGASTGEDHDTSALSRAFLYAGARGLLVSHWYVDSDSTRRLVEATLSSPGATTNQAAALRDAMIAVRDETFLIYAHPYYWSSFSLLGGAGP